MDNMKIIYFIFTLRGAIFLVSEASLRIRLPWEDKHYEIQIKNISVIGLIERSLSCGGKCFRGQRWPWNSPHHVGGHEYWCLLVFRQDCFGHAWGETTS